MNDFDRAVYQMMNDFGFSATYLKPNGTPYDPATGQNNVIYQETAVQAIQMDLNLRSNGTTVKPATTIESGDKQVYVRPTNKTDPTAQPLQVNPETDKIRINGTVWRILTFKEINTTASDQILIELYIRK